MARNESSEQLISQGLAALASGDFVQAAQSAQAALRHNRGLGDAWVILCSALIKMESKDDVRALSDALLAISAQEPARLPLSVELARALARRGHCAHAVDVARDVSKRAQLTPNYHEALGSAFAMCGLFEESLYHTAKAVELMPDHASFIYSHALTLRYLGRLKEAEQALDRVITLNPAHCLAYFTRADLKRWTAEQNHIGDIKSVLASQALSPLEQTQLEFALFKEQNDCKLYDEAWQTLMRGCTLAQQTRAYPAKVKEDAAVAATQAFKGLWPNAAAKASNTPTPIFIIGLPRSGTTLVERILAQHKDVTAMGETHGFPIALKDVAGIAHGDEIDAAAINRSADLDWAQVRDQYLANTRYLAGDTRYCTDKLPHNYEFVGQIMQAFPGTKVINLTRNPLDSLFGALRVLFGPGSYLWSYSQADLAQAFRVYRHLTDSWRTAFGPQFIDVSLSCLIEDPEATIRKLLNDLDLEFDPLCLAPESADSGVSTASSVQIRSPINSSGVGVWKHYAHYLEPLRLELERGGFVDANGEQII